MAEKNVALVLLEIRLADMTGYELCHELKTAYGDAVPVFFVTGLRIEPLDRIAGLLLGADDFIVKPFEPGELVARVRRIAGRRFVPRSQPGAPAVTPREQEVLDLLALGRRPKEIATELTISNKTVATHIQHMLEKMGVHSRAELIARAYVLGIVAGLSGARPV